jgi:hypothetical protein
MNPPLKVPVAVATPFATLHPAERRIDVSGPYSAAEQCHFGLGKAWRLAESVDVLAAEQVQAFVKEALEKIEGRPTVTDHVLTRCPVDESFRSQL